MKANKALLPNWENVPGAINCSTVSDDMKLGLTR
jgi:hypothetical protein